MPAHTEAWNGAFDALGYYDARFVPALHGGLSTKDVLTLLVPNVALSVRMHLQVLKNERFAREMIRVMPGAGSMLFDLRFQAGTKIAIVTGASRERAVRFVEKFLKSVGNVNVYTAEDVEFGKPEPEMFALAAEMEHVQARECVMVDDGVAGIIGAAKAGMTPVGFTKDSFTAERLLDAGAVAVVQSFGELRQWLITNTTAGPRLFL